MLPLSALRAFEAAARLGSFTRAAAELVMTQAAVSYQIKQLEQRLGATLFRRAGRSVALTPAGERLADEVIPAFAQLRGACAKVSEEQQSRLTITALPTVASHWLVPRLGEFQRRHPEYTVRLEASVEVRNLLGGDCDVAIRSGGGDWPGCQSVSLFPSRYGAVCGPELAERLTSPSDLLDVPLFGREDWWRQWLEEAGVTTESLCVTDLATQPSELAAALAQRGAAMVTPDFFREDFAGGRIVAPFATLVTGRSSYWLVYRTGAQAYPKIRDFERWLVAEAGTAAD